MFKTVYNVMAVKKQETYSQAIKRLEEIVRQIDNNEMDIDILSEKIKEANELILFCSEKLTKVDKEVEKLVGEKG
jgi:exodeoxyribonuclease VII small subunit